MFARFQQDLTTVHTADDFLAALERGVVIE
jgi:hypothetical protein